MMPKGIRFAAFVLVFGWTALPISAQFDCRAPKPPGPPSASPGKFCGGLAPTSVGRLLDLDRECKALYGSNASAVAKRQDAYGWACVVPGHADRGIADMHRACRRTHGNNAIATLVGIRVNDWRCLNPADVGGHVVPILLYPVEHVRISEAAFATDSLRRLNTLMSGVRTFYQGKTSAFVRGTNAFILLTRTSATEWQNLALCTDAVACAAIGSPYPLDRYLYLNRIKAELKDGQWNRLIAHSSVRLAAFVTLGASPAQTPTWCGAAVAPGVVAVAAPSNSYASCDPTTNNPFEYEDAFYGAAHELGHAMKLRHSDAPPNLPFFEGCLNVPPPEYVFNDTNPNSNLIRPDNLAESIMCTGNGTSSELFPFEVRKLLPFLLGWH